MSERHDIWKIADAIQMDLRAASAKLVQLRALLSTIDLPDPITATCPFCSVKMRGPNTLAEHVYHSHDGPTPPLWIAIEAMSHEPPDADEPDLGRAEGPR